MASGVAKELETAITQIVAAALTGQITDPFARISVIVRAIFYPSFPESAKVQLMVVNGLQGLLLLGCLWTLWLRKGSLPLMRRVEGYLVPNTPIIFTTFMALYYAFAIVAVSRTIGIFEGKRTYPGLYIIRGLCWVWLYLAAWFRGLGTLIESPFY
ncbi:hypothetical protein BT69DRAFT_78613 [Atractiella rhizophila]|nr:hypothetical protein BT69DRAFT_78613 [Atractiella rhizophila]